MGNGVTTIPTTGYNAFVAKYNITNCNNTSSSDIKEACGTYTWMDGNTYTSSNNTATHIIPNAAGCDSVITLDLTIINIDATINNSNNFLSASNTTADSYQWVDCNNSNAAITGETSATFTPTNNGSFAVEITVGTCTETSDCETISTIGLNENELKNIVLYPNPTTSILSIKSDAEVEKMEVINLYGEVVQTFKQTTFSVENLTAGVYFVNVHTNTGIAKLRFVKQ
jgi:hypothetical protein